MDVVPIDQVSDGGVDLAVCTGSVDGAEPRSDGGMGNDVLPGGEGVTESLSERDEPLLGLSVMSIDGVEILSMRI